MGGFCGCDTSSLELPANLPALFHHVNAHICLLLSLLRTDTVSTSRRSGSERMGLARPTSEETFWTIPDVPGKGQRYFKGI